MKKLLLLLIAFAWSSSSCEKDDICDANTVTTPRLVIDFYDVTNPTLAKSVTNLAIVGEGLTTGIIFNGVSKIKVPLNIAADLSKYKFILNYGNANASLINEDELQFDYTRNNVYVSRACGYKTVFTFAETNPYTQTDAATADGLWMKDITVTQPNILNENETHLTISF
jgi:hypothetical protein